MSLVLNSPLLLLWVYVLAAGTKINTYRAAGLSIGLAEWGIWARMGEIAMEVDPTYSPPIPGLSSLPSFGTTCVAAHSSIICLLGLGNFGSNSLPDVLH